MNKKLVLIIGVVIILIIFCVLVFLRNQQQAPLSPPLATLSQTQEPVKPSETLIEYIDPSGFSFNYPDNLSITKNEVDDNTYADLQLYAKQVNGSLSLKIADTKLKTLNEWIKANVNNTDATPKEVKLGTLKAMEIKTSDRLLLGALDQGVLFTIEMPLIDQDFWMKVYDKILADFSFAPPSQATATSAEEDSSLGISFEGEEVVE